MHATNIFKLSQTFHTKIIFLEDDPLLLRFWDQTPDRDPGSTGVVTLTPGSRHARPRDPRFRCRSVTHAHNVLRGGYGSVARWRNSGSHPYLRAQCTHIHIHTSTHTHTQHTHHTHTSTHTHTHSHITPTGKGVGRTGHHAREPTQRDLRRRCEQMLQTKFLLQSTK